MKKTVILSSLIIILLFSLTSEGFCFADERRANEVVTDFYSFMSQGMLKYMDYSLTPATHQGKDEVPTPERYKVISEFYDLAHKVKTGKLKILVETLKLNAKSINGSTIGANVRYKMKITNRETKEVTIREGMHRFILVQWDRSWRIVDIEDKK